MAARIPTFADVGFNDPKTTTPLPTYPQSDPVAAAQGEFGQGLQQAGAGAIRLGNDLEDRRQALNVANATVNMTTQLMDLHTQAQIETDPAKLANIRQQFNTILPTSANAIDDPQKKALFVAQHSPSVLQAQFDVDKRLAVLGKESHAANTERDLDTMAGKAAATGNPTAAEAALLAGKQQIDATAAAIGNPQWGYTKYKQFANQVFTGTADRLIEQGRPDQAKALLDAHVGDIDPIHADRLRFRAQAKGTSIVGDQLGNWSLGLGPEPAASGSGMSVGGAVSGRISETSGIPSLRPVPSEYAPIVDKAAMQYGVPAELLARTIHAESSFNPGAVSPTGARGIAQFITSTANQYGVNRSDSTSSIMGAAHYLSDLHQRTGSWQGALSGYLGSDPWQDKSYTGNGAIQLASVLDSGKAPAAAPATTAAASAPAGQPGQVEVWGDSLGVGLRSALKAPGYAHGGDTPETIFAKIQEQPEDHWAGKTVVLPSGSNGNQMPVVEKTIQYLKDKGANVVSIGYGPKFPDKNVMLEDITRRLGVPLVPAQGVGASEGVHPSPDGYAAMGQQVQAAHQNFSQAAPETGTAGTAAASQLQPANASAASSTDVGSDQPQPGATGGSAQLNRTGLPSLSESWDRIQRSNFDPATKEHAWTIARNKYTAMEADAARSTRLSDQAQKQLVNQATDRIYADVYSGNPQITPQQVSTDPAFASDEGRRHQMLELMGNPPAMGVSAARSQQIATSLIQRIRLPEGDPNKITDEGKIFDQMPNLNRPDLEFALKQFRDIRAPDGETLRQKRDSFFKQYSQYITKSNPLSGQGDPVGNARLYELEQYVDHKIDDYRKGSKNPLDLFNPRNPDFPGSPDVIRQFQPSMQQSMQSVNQWASGTPTPLPPVGTQQAEPPQTQLPEGGVYAPIPPKPLDMGPVPRPLAPATSPLAPAPAPAIEPPQATPPTTTLRPNSFLMPPIREPDETVEHYRARTGL